MQKLFSQRSGSAPRAISWARVSTQKSHTGDNLGRHTGGVKIRDVLKSILGHNHNQGRSQAHNGVGAHPRALLPVHTLIADDISHKAGQNHAAEKLQLLVPGQLPSGNYPPNIIHPCILPPNQLHNPLVQERILELSRGFHRPVKHNPSGGQMPYLVEIGCGYLNIFRVSPENSFFAATTNISILVIFERSNQPFHSFYHRYSR